MEETAGIRVVIEQLVNAGFERHAAKVAAVSANGNAERAFALILSWDGAPPPPLPPAPEQEASQPAAPGVYASALRLSASDAASPGVGGIVGGERLEAAAGGGIGAAAQHAAGPSIPSLRATEAEHRQRLMEKQRELDAKQRKQQRGEAKRRREQELAIWKEQRDEAKQRKGSGGGGGSGAADQGSAVGGRARGQAKEEGEKGGAVGSPPSAKTEDLGGGLSKE